ncbi:MAG: alpha/beta hydrolase [Bradymonadaceae bacterium]|nr:alpha/beta hydrolase [Lujinxingiaceae bacterium]
MLFDHPLISERYFFPFDEQPPEVSWVEAGGHRLACYRRVIDEKAPMVVHFHGNGEVVADYVPGLADALLAMGVNVFFAEYRGYGGSTGSPKLGSMLGDVEAIYEATGFAPERLVVFGRSIGSIYAVEFARRYPNIGGLVLESAIADVLERILLRAMPDELGCTLDELEAERDAYLDHEKKLAGYSGLLLVLHARGDHLVEPSHAERLHAWARSPDKRLVLFDRGDHNSIFAYNQAAYLAELERFLGKVTGAGWL